MAATMMKALVKREATKGIWMEEVPVPTPAFASDPTWSPLLSGQR